VQDSTESGNPPHLLASNIPSSSRIAGNQPPPKQVVVQYKQKMVYPHHNGETAVGSMCFPRSSSITRSTVLLAVTTKADPPDSTVDTLSEAGPSAAAVVCLAV